jgi:2-polyprenyl-3-methyl-5-hydroxy-6-metoxy-1,4-benzoquinol methylase
MGTMTENKRLGTECDWQERGDEWSVEWGTTAILWWGTIRPRIHAFVPTGTILEIAPGFGRCTQYLKDLCQHLMVVDLTDRCIEACKERFSSDNHITYYVNDGKSLEMIPDHSVDFIFSFDSLVHVEADVMEAYLSQMVLKLKPHGVGFIHHSNIGAYVNRLTGKLPFYIDNKSNGSNWRAESMTAKLFEDYCDKTGLQCVAQEVIAFYPEFSFRWGRPGRRFQRVRQKIVDQYGRVLNDCFSVFTPKKSTLERPNKVSINKQLMEEVRYLSQLSQLYDASSFKTKAALARQRS